MVWGRPTGQGGTSHEGRRHTPRVSTRPGTPASRATTSFCLGSVPRAQLVVILHRGGRVRVGPVPDHRPESRHGSTGSVSNVPNTPPRPL